MNKDLGGFYVCSFLCYAPLSLKNGGPALEQRGYREMSSSLQLKMELMCSCSLECLVDVSHKNPETGLA